MGKDTRRFIESGAPGARRAGGAALDLAEGLGGLPGAAAGAQPAAEAQLRSAPARPALRGLRSNADAAVAQLLLAPDLPADEKPHPGDRVLLAGLVWGGTTLIELEPIARGGVLTARALFDLPAAGLPPDFRLVQNAGDELVVTVPETLSAEVHGGGAPASFQQLHAAGKARLVEAPFRGHAYIVQGADRVVVRVAPQLTLIVRYVRASRAPERALLSSIDARFVAALAAAVLAVLLFAVLVHRAPKSAAPPDDDLWRAQARYARFQARPSPAPETPRPPEVAGVAEGAKAAGEEGKLGKPEAKQKQAAPSRKGAKAVDPRKSERDRKLVMRKGLLAALRKLGAPGGGAASSVLGPGGLGSGIEAALGGVKARAAAGDTYGVGALGARGVGAGGGGKALGIGGLGTKGSGRGRGGYGDADLGGRGKQETEFIPGKTTVVGGLSRDVINRIIQRHYNEIKYCYEKELSRNPSLYGKVALLFVIDGAGKVSDALVQQSTLSSEPVESCMVNHVRRWAFPQPEGGGTVEVTYPYVFKASGQ
ncbi:MAG: hypothetical protein NVSMB23_00540 [Myxococcales bacterium]